MFKYLLTGFIFAYLGFAQPYNGTEVGSLAYVAGESGYGQQLQGTTTSVSNPTTHVTIPSGATNFSGNFAVSWRYKETTDESFQGIFQTSSTSCNVYGYAGYVTCVVEGTVLTTSGVDVSDGSVHAIYVSRNGTTAKIFVDGVERASATVAGSANLGTTTSTITYDGTNRMRSTSYLDEFAIWTTATPTNCTPCTGSESGLRALYHFDGNLNDSAGTASTLVAGTLSLAVGLDFTAATGGTSPYSYQLQSYTGACSSGSFSNDGAALTGQTSTALFARTGATVRCFRVLVTDAASATAVSNSITAPSGGMSVN